MISFQNNFSWLFCSCRIVIFHHLLAKSNSIFRAILFFSRFVIEIWQYVSLSSGESKQKIVSFKSSSLSAVKKKGYWQAVFGLNFINIRLSEAEVAVGQRDTLAFSTLESSHQRELRLQCFARNFPIRWSFVVLRYLRFAHDAPFADFSWLLSASCAVCQTPSAKCTLPSTQRNVTLCFLLTSRAINSRSRE